MTGCPNGCARSYIAEIGFIGTALGKYNLQLGGDHAGMRLNKVYKESLDETAILQELDSALLAIRHGKKIKGIFRGFCCKEEPGIIVNCQLLIIYGSK